MSYNIKKLLRIVEENLEVISVEQELIKKKQTLAIYAVLSPKPQACQRCGSTPFDSKGNQIIVKNGTKESSVRFENYNHMPTIMKLKKQKYVCKNCQHYSTAKTYFVKDNCFIAEHVKFKIINLLREKISLKFIGKLCSVSSTTVTRVLQSLEKYIPANQPMTILPKVLMVDEFRSHAKNEDKMSFICADGETGKLVDILSSRKSNYLEKHFQLNYASSLDDVQFIVTDMNAPYFKLTKSCFKNAKIVVDRFHVVSHINKAFNEFRVREIKSLIQIKKKVEAKKIKSNWKLFLKNRRNIDWIIYHSSRSFPAPKYPLLTEGMRLDRLLAFSDNLKNAYNFFHDLQDAFRDKDSIEFFHLLKNIPDYMDKEFKNKLQNLLAYEEGITNALIYPYSNGSLEAKNTHIKTLKRVSYGFNSFSNMKTRIFLMNNLIQIK